MASRRTTISTAFCVVLFLLNTNQYSTNTMGKNRAKEKELKNIKLAQNCF
jgi:hypothetical protein